MLIIIIQPIRLLNLFTSMRTDSFCDCNCAVCAIWRRFPRMVGPLYRDAIRFVDSQHFLASFPSKAFRCENHAHAHHPPLLHLYHNRSMCGDVIIVRQSHVLQEKLSGLFTMEFSDSVYFGSYLNTLEMEFEISRVYFLELTSRNA